jgi:hypothetical protein
VGTDAPPNWREVFLDSEAAHIWGREMGWGLRGGDTKSFLGHTWSYFRATGRSTGRSSPARWMMITGRLSYRGQIPLYPQVWTLGMAVPIVRT